MSCSLKDLQNSRTVPAMIGNCREFEKIERGVLSALETYSNVHRGTGHFSMISTELFERAREIVIEFLGLKKDGYVVVFCTGHGAEILKTQLKSKNYHIVSSQDIGLPLGLRALVVKKSDLPKGLPFQTGGNVVKIVSPNSVIWADAPYKFEAGTPGIINVIAFASAFKVKKQFGNGCFRAKEDTMSSATEILYHDELSGYSGSQLLDKLRKLAIGHNLHVPTAEGEQPYINFDNAASTPTFFPIWNAVRMAWRQSEKVHVDIVHEVKKILADFLGASIKRYDTIFTSNTTEALNIAARLIQNEYKDGSELVILNTLLEHNSNELPWRYISGASLIRFPVDSEGFMNLDELEITLRKYNRQGIFGKKRIRIVAISGASNVLGTINNIEKVGKIAHKYNARILVDAAQLVAHRRIHMGKCDIDYLAFCGHKVYAPFGSGALIVKKEYMHLDPFELRRIKASGEENVIGIAAMGKAVTLLQRIGMDVIEKREKALVRRLLRGLPKFQGIEVFGIGDPDSKRFHQKGGVISFSFKGVPHNLAAKELAEYGGIGVRHGCFCAHLLVKRLLKIDPLRAFAADVCLILLPGLTSLLLPGLIRVSFGLGNEESEVDRLIQVLEKIDSVPRSIVNRRLAFTRNGTPFLKRTDVQERMEEFLESCIKKVYSLRSD